MGTYKFALDEEHSKKLEEMAKKEGMSVQDYIRNKLFSMETIYTPAEAMRRVKEKYNSGDKFTIPELFGSDWQLKRGAAGVFGKQFRDYTIDNPGVVRFIGMIDGGKHAQYVVL